MLLMIYRRRPKYYPIFFLGFMRPLPPAAISFLSIIFLPDIFAGVVFAVGFFDAGFFGIDLVAIGFFLAYAMI